MKLNFVLVFIFVITIAIIASCTPSQQKLTPQTVLAQTTATILWTKTPSPTATPTFTPTLSPIQTEIPIVEYPINTNWKEWYKCEIPLEAILDGSYYRYLKTLDWSGKWPPERIAMIKYLPLEINMRKDIIPSPKTAPNYEARRTRPYEHLAFGIAHKGSQANMVVVVQFSVENLDPSRYPIAIGLYDLEGGQYTFSVWPEWAKIKQMRIMTQDNNVISFSIEELNLSETDSLNIATKEDYYRFMGIENNGDYVRPDHLGDPTALDGKIVNLGILPPGYVQLDPVLYKQYQ